MNNPGPYKKAVTPRFGPGYLTPMRNFFLRLNEDDEARAEFLKNADHAVVKYGIIDKLPGITACGHADSNNLRTLVLPPAPPPAPPGAKSAGLGLRAAAGARASTNVVFFVRANMVLWFTLTEALWGEYDDSRLAPSDRIMLNAFRNPQFKARLLSEPAAVMTEYGMHIPAGLEIKMVEQTEDIVHVILPPKGNLEDLSHLALQELVSGWCWLRALGEPSLGDIKN